MTSNKFTIPAYAEGEQSVTISDGIKSFTYTTVPSAPDEELTLTEVTLEK